jgi:hypothetical protein
MTVRPRSVQDLRLDRVHMDDNLPLGPSVTPGTDVNNPRLSGQAQHKRGDQ